MKSLRKWRTEAATMGDRFTIARMEKGMTQAQLARYCGVNIKTINRLETDQHIPSATLVGVIADLFDCSLDWLILGKHRVSTPVRRAP
jgi:transcriptional regulator with XRE-family HTH domain